LCEKDGVEFVIGYLARALSPSIRCARYRSATIRAELSSSRCSGTPKQIGAAKSDGSVLSVTIPTISTQ